jgi:Holliday junction resolvase
VANANYRAGRAIEYEVVKHFQNKGYTAFRTAGSHGPYDVVAIRADRKPELVQCKRTSDVATAERLLKVFKTNTMPSLYYHQTMWIRVKGNKVPLTNTI